MIALMSSFPFPSVFAPRVYAHTNMPQPAGCSQQSMVSDVFVVQDDDLPE